MLSPRFLFLLIVFIIKFVMYITILCLLPYKCHLVLFLNTNIYMYIVV